MFKHCLQIVLCFLIATAPVYASQFCPDVNQIKKGNFEGWLALYGLSDEPASPTQIEKFKNSIQYFTEAFWNADYLNGRARCNYENDADVQLAKNLSAPGLSSPSWHLSWGTYTCRSQEQTACPFPDNQK